MVGSTECCLLKKAKALFCRKRATASLRVAYAFVALDYPMSQSDYKSLISYFLKEGFYQHAVDEATEQIRRRGNDTYLLYWKGNSTSGLSTHIIPVQNKARLSGFYCLSVCRFRTVRFFAHDKMTDLPICPIPAPKIGPISA